MTPEQKTEIARRAIANQRAQEHLRCLTLLKWADDAAERRQQSLDLAGAKSAADTASHALDDAMSALNPLNLGYTGTNPTRHH